MPAEDDDELIAAIGRAGLQFTGETETLVAAGVARGRTLRRRRNASVAGGVASLAVIGTLGILVGTPGSPAHHAAGAPEGGSSAAAVASPTPSTTRAPSPPTSTPPGITRDQLLALVKTLLPPGRTSREAGQGTADPGQPRSDNASVTMDFDDGNGRARLQLQMGRVSPGTVNGMVDCPGPGASPPADSCTTELTSQGYTLTMLQSYADRTKATKDWRASLLDPGGWLVQADEWNAPAEQPTAPSRPEPPLTTDALKTLVTHDQGWASVEAGAALFPRTPAAFPSADGQELLGTLNQLVPAGFTTSDGGIDDENAAGGGAHITVDDGHGASMLQVGVQDWSSMVASDSSLVLQIFGNAQVLPNGDKVAVDTDFFTGGKRGRNNRAWMVEVLRPDGIRVTAMALNSWSSAADATRPKPVLTTAQLTAIATSPLWQLHRGPQ
jgi:hypothetical protein